MDRLASWPESELDFRQLGCPLPSGPTRAPGLPLGCPGQSQELVPAFRRPWVSSCPSMTLQPSGSYRVPNWFPGNFFIPAVDYTQR